MHVIALNQKVADPYRMVVLRTGECTLKEGIYQWVRW